MRFYNQLKFHTSLNFSKRVGSVAHPLYFPNKVLSLNAPRTRSVSSATCQMKFAFSRKLFGHEDTLSFISAMIEVSITESCFPLKSPHPYLGGVLSNLSHHLINKLQICPTPEGHTCTAPNARFAKQIGCKCRYAQHDISQERWQIELVLNWQNWIRLSEYCLPILPTGAVYTLDLFRYFIIIIHPQRFCPQWI